MSDGIDTRPLPAPIPPTGDPIPGELVTLEAPSVDSGWRSRKLIVGVLLGLLVILAVCFLMFVAVTGVFHAQLSDEATKALTKFDPEYWLYGLIAALVFVGGCIGLISFDKVIDLGRECIPILKAKYGIVDKPKA